MDQASFDIESRSQNTDGRSPVQFNSTIVVVPVDVHGKICKIISLLSQALVLALSLMKAMVSTQQVPSNNCVEHMLEEEQLIHPELGQHGLLEPANSNRPWRGRPVSNITFARGQGFWSGYGGAGVDDAGSVQGDDTTTVEW